MKKRDQPRGIVIAVGNQKGGGGKTTNTVLLAAALGQGGNPLARDMLRDGMAEGVVRCRHREHPCQARIDWVSYNTRAGIVDLKTADDLDGFEFALRALGYVHQLAFYHTLAAVACGHVLPVHVVAAEKREPFRCGV